MKKENISISMESEKLRATKKYMDKKEISLERELCDALQKLYEKHVPVAVREYIDETTEDTSFSAKINKNKTNNTLSHTQEVV